MLHIIQHFYEVNLSNLLVQDSRLPYSQCCDQIVLSVRTKLAHDLNSKLISQVISIVQLYLAKAMLQQQQQQQQ